MAGHSKWANIKHRKGIQDARRSKKFTRILKEITLAARNGGPEPENNPTLRLGIQNARGANIPKDTIERAINKGISKESEFLQSVTYEANLPNNIACIIEATTDNLNRTLANIRAILNKHGGQLATNGSFNFIFARKGIFELEINSDCKLNKDTLELELIDAGADDIEFENNLIYVSCLVEHFGALQKQIENLTLNCINAQLEYQPTIYKKIESNQEIQISKIIEKLSDDEDITAIYHNLDIQERTA